MSLRALCLLACALALAGCASPVASGSTATSTPTANQAGPTLTALPAPTNVRSVHPKAEKTRLAASRGDDYRAGQLDLSARDYRSAAPHFRKSIRQHRNVAASYAGLGEAEDGQGQYLKGYQAYRKAVSMQPHNQAYLYGAAYSALSARQFHDSINYASLLIQQNPKSVAAYHVRMIAYGSLTLTKQQLSDARKIVELEPNNPQALNDYGIALGNNRKYLESIQAFSRAIRLQPRYYAYYSNRAIVENVIHQQKAALADLKTAERLAPDPQTKKMMAVAIRNLKKQMAKSK